MLRCSRNKGTAMDRLISRYLPDLHLAWPKRYGLATLIMAVAVLAHWLLGGYLAGYQLLLFWPAVFLVALLLDSGTGYYATAVSVVAACWFADPPGSFVLHKVQEAHAASARHEVFVHQRRLQRAGQMEF